MAANACLRLIERYEVDPAKVRYLALGTESSTQWPVQSSSRACSIPPSVPGAAGSGTQL